MRPAEPRRASDLRHGRAAKRRHTLRERRVRCIDRYERDERPGACRDGRPARMQVCIVYERVLRERLPAGSDGVTLHGSRDMDARSPTFAFTVARYAPAAVARHLARRGIFAWPGRFHAVETIAALGPSCAGGLVREPPFTGNQYSGTMPPPRIG